MSFTRNRSRSSHSPNVKPRALQLHLQGAQDAMTAFDGYESSGPLIQAAVLSRPTGRRRKTVLQRLLEKGRSFLSSLVQTLRWTCINHWCLAIDGLALVLSLLAKRIVSGPTVRLVRASRVGKSIFWAGIRYTKSEALKVVVNSYMTRFDSPADITRVVVSDELNVWDFLPHI